MPETTLKITLDAADFEKALRETEQTAHEAARAMGEVQGADVDVSADASQAVQAAREATQAVEAVPERKEIAVTADASQAVGSLEQTTKSLSAFKRLASSLPAEMKALGQAIQAACEGWAGVIVFAVQQIVELARLGWDVFTESSEEAVLKSQGTLDVLRQEADGLEKLRQEADSYLERLAKLASVGGSSNAVQEESLRLVRLLEEAYGNLGAEVDRATGRILNLDEVTARANGRQAAMESGNELQQANALYVQARAKWAKLAQDRGWASKSFAGGQAEFDSYRSFVKGDLGRLAAQMRQNAKGAMTSDDVQDISEIAALLEQAAEKQRRGTSLLRTGYATEEERRKAVAASAGRLSDAKAGREADAREAEKARFDRELSRLDDIEEKKRNRYGKLDLVDGEADELRTRLAEAEAVAARATTEEGRLDAKARAEELRRQIDAKEREREALFDEIAALEDEKEKAVEALAGGGEREAALARLKAAGEYEAAEALRLQQELKEKNLTLTEAETKAILERRRATAAQGLRNDLAEQGRQLLRQHGGTRQAALDRAAERKGGALDKGERDAVLRMEELGKALQGLKLDLSHMQTRTNSLTARGGFAGGAATTRLEAINAEIRNHASRQSRLLDQIRTLVQRLATTEV